METKEYHDHDKTKYPPGPWHDEPDKKQWQDKETGLPCLIVRNGCGALCGYVGVLPGHPGYGVEYGVLPFDVDCHGGLTYSDFCQENGHICHHAPGEPEPWWLGFDCAHSDDYAPCDRFWRGGEYRTFEYVEREVTQLAKQLAEVKA